MMDVKQQIRTEIITAISSGLDDYRNNPKSVKSEVEKRHDVPENATIEHYRRAIDIIESNKRKFADFVANEIEKSTDVGELGTPKQSMGTDAESVKVSADGGSIFTQLQADSAILALSSFNAFCAGWNIAQENHLLAVISFLTLCMFIAVHVGHKYNMEIVASK